MTAMNNLLINMLHCQQQIQNDTTHVLLALHQSQRDNANNLLINDIPTFDGKPWLHFD